MLKVRKTRVKPRFLCWEGMTICRKCCNVVAKHLSSSAGRKYVTSFSFSHRLELSDVLSPFEEHLFSILSQQIRRQNHYRPRHLYFVYLCLRPTWFNAFISCANTLTIHYLKISRDFSSFNETKTLCLVTSSDHEGILGIIY